MEELLNLQKKWNITDKDLYILSKLEDDKKTSSFLEKEKLNAMQRSIILKYKIGLADKVNIFKALKKSNFHDDLEQIEKYKNSENNEELNEAGNKGKFSFVAGILIIIVIVIAVSQSGNKTTASKQYGYEENGVYAVITMGNNLCNIIVASSNENIIKTKGTYSINNNNVEFNWDNSFGPKEALISNQNGEEVLIVSGPEGDAVYKKIEK